MCDKLDLIKGCKVVPVIKIDNIADALPLAKALLDGGAGVMEITFRTPCARDAIALVKRNYPNLLVGAGTILTAEQAHQAIDAKSDFIVSPGFSVAVADVCRDNGVLYLPGAITPTEIMSVLQYGLNVMKFFPCSNFGGIDTLKSYSAVFPQVQFMPTGGVGEGNIAQLLALPNVFACGASSMATASMISNGEFDKITNSTAKIHKLVDGI